VKDVAQAIVLALDLGVPGESYNIGSSVGRSNLEVLQKISGHAVASGITPMIRHLETRTFDVAANVLDSHKIQNLTGWHPQIDFGPGIEQTWEWCMQFLRESSLK